jgi:N-acyl-D-aspartate/D-glutamate deacylase
MKDEDIRTFYRQPWVMVSSDGGIGMRHPRGTGTFPRVLGRYVRDQKWLSLEEAVHKMTALPADRLGLQDRGRLRAGMKADLVIFDPLKVIDRSTMTQPFIEPVGVTHVFVNGIQVVSEGSVTGQRPGEVLSRKGRK